MDTIFINKNTYLGNVPDDIKKILVGMTIDEFIPNKIQRLNFIMNLKNDSTLKMLLYDNINFWIQLWLKYVSSKISEHFNSKETPALNELRESYIFAMKLYERIAKKEEIIEKIEQNNNPSKCYDEYLVNLRNCILQSESNQHKYAIIYLGYEKMRFITDLNSTLSYYISNIYQASDITKHITEKHNLELAQKEQNATQKILKMIENGADINGVSNEHPMLYYALTCSHPNRLYIVNYLIELGADTSVLYQPNLIKDILVKRNHSIINLLIILRKQLYPCREAFDDDVDYLDELLYIDIPMIPALNIMIDNGMKITQINEQGETLLHVCVRYAYANSVSHNGVYKDSFNFLNYIATIRSLVKRNIDINIKNNDGLTAADLNDKLHCETYDKDYCCSACDGENAYFKYYTQIKDLINIPYTPKSWWSWLLS